MSEIYDSADSFEKLINTEYEIVIGRKGITKRLFVKFEKKDFRHLCGFQHLTDRQFLQDAAEKVFDKIFNREFSEESIISSKYYEQIKDRIFYLSKLEFVFDSNETVFKYNPILNQYSVVQADFLLKNSINLRNIFTFLSKSDDEKYFCRSFFPENRIDYSLNQTAWTLLFKKKINKLTNEEQVLYAHPKFQ